MTDIKDMSNEEFKLFINTEMVFHGFPYECRTELLSRLKAGHKAIAAMKQIGDLVYNNSCHADTSNEVTRIFMAYSKITPK